MIEESLLAPEHCRIQFYQDSSCYSIQDLSHKYTAAEAEKIEIAGDAAGTIL